MTRQRNAVRLAALVLISAVVPVSGQYQRPLNRSLQVPDRRLNPPVLRPNYAARNNLITGNVTGEGYFRGTVGYGAPGEFRDETSSDELFRFRARSAAQANVAGLVRRRGPTHDGTAYFSTYAASAAGGIREGTVNIPTMGDYTATAHGRYGGYDPYAGLAQDSLGAASRLNQTRLEDGRIVETASSPLLGMRRYEYDPTKALGLLDLVGGPPPAATGAAEEGTETPAASPPESLDGAASAPEPVWKPALELGAYLTGVTGQAIDLGNELPIEKKIRRIEDSIFRAASQREHEAGDDVYLDLLSELQQRQTDPAGAGPREAEPLGMTEASGPWSGLAADLAVPSPAQLSAAIAERDSALAEIVGLPRADALLVRGRQGTGGRRPAALKEAVRAGIDDAVVDPAAAIAGNKDTQAALEPPVDLDLAEPLGAEAKAALEVMLHTLDHGASIKSLVGRQETRINKLLAEAEEHLAARRYYDAQESYRLVLIGVPGHPMASVGLVHAEIGAGMMRSAALRLRTILEHHPELIANRYDARLLPKVGRVDEIARKLQAMIERSSRPGPALLLAYLGYQAGQRDLVAFGLDLAEARSPLDPLTALLRRIWLGPADDALTPPDDAAPGAAE